MPNNRMGRGKSGSGSRQQRESNGREGVERKQSASGRGDLRSNQGPRQRSSSSGSRTGRGRNAGGATS